MYTFVLTTDVRCICVHQLYNLQYYYGNTRMVIGDRELVLDCIVERKTMDDLASSIKDSRYHEQKVTKIYMITLIISYLKQRIS